MYLALTCTRPKKLKSLKLYLSHTPPHTQLQQSCSCRTEKIFQQVTLSLSRSLYLCWGLGLCILLLYLLSVLSLCLQPPSVLLTTTTTLPLPSSSFFFSFFLFFQILVLCFSSLCLKVKFLSLCLKVKVLSLCSALSRIAIVKYMYCVQFFLSKRDMCWI